MKVLISDKLSEAGLEIFKNAPGIIVDYQPGLGKDIPKLKEALKDAQGLAIRSGTTVTKELLESAPQLKVIGRAGIGVDNVDVPEASKRGIIVMNTPGGNTVTTAEHAISMMCALTREIPQATASVKSGKWEKSRFMGSEMYQKTLGLIGCGNIGKIVADRALGLRMKVITFDPFLTNEMATQIGVIKVEEIEELYKNADYITLHVPKTEKTANMLNATTFAQMKKGVYIINCARGGIINEKDLADAIEKGIVAGAALDVFDKEPVDPANPLLKLDQVICTPHLGASTDEAQENVALDVAHQIVDYLVTGTILNAVNFPSVSGEVMAQLKPYLILAEKIGSLQGQLASESPESITIEYAGDLTKMATAPLTIAILRGILKPMLGDEVNLVNAPVFAKERGIKVIESKKSEVEDFTSLVSVCLKFKDSERKVAGTIFGKVHPRIVRLNKFYLEALPEGNILIIENEDKPGVVGNVGSILAKNNINISRLQLGVSGKGQTATAFYNIESSAKQSVVDELSKLPGILSVKQVEL